MVNGEVPCDRSREVTFPCSWISLMFWSCLEMEETKKQNHNNMSFINVFYRTIQILKKRV